jgi:hypothetical protein
MENLLSVLHPCCPAEADVLCKTRRRVEHGLTTVGLKIHCLGDDWELLNLIKALGGRSEVIGTRVYAHARASVTVILPPVGNARSAILLLECLERYFEHPIFHNPSYQIQVCSPCRLDGPRAAILAIAFYLGSDVLRRYSLGDLTTTFSEDPLGRGISIEDAALSSTMAKATSIGTSSGGTLRRIACRYGRNFHS